MPHELTIILKYHLLLFYATKTNHFLTGLWHAMNSGFHDNQQWSAQWLDWEEVLQNTSQSQTCTEKGQGNCLVVCCLSDSLQLSESWINHYFWVVCPAMRCTKNRKACSWHWSTDCAQFFFTTPDCTSYNQKFNEFLPYMEKSVFMGMLDDFVWERVCRDVKEKKFYERKQTVFVLRLGPWDYD